MANATAQQGAGEAMELKPSSHHQRRQFWKTATPYLMVAPVFVYYIFFWLRPVLSLVVGSFTTAEGGLTLGNFGLVFQDPSFWPAVLNTTIIVIFSVILEFVLALLLAFLINDKFPGSSAFLFVVMIPMALPAMAVAAMWQTGLTAHGWINSLLFYIGFLEEGQKIYYLTGDDAKNLILIILVDAWTVIPFMMIILLAGLQSFPEEAKEAGYVFGGNVWTVVKKITIPMLKPTIITAVIDSGQKDHHPHVKTDDYNGRYFAADCGHSNLAHHRPPVRFQPSARPRGTGRLLRRRSRRPEQ